MKWNTILRVIIQSSLVLFYSCSGEQIKFEEEYISGSIVSFSFEESNNRDVLLENVEGTITNDSSILVRIPYLIENRQLVPTIVFEGLGRLVLHSDKTLDLSSKTDYTGLVIYDVINEKTGEISKSYTVRVTSYTGLPVLNLYTNNNEVITSKTEYVDATISCFNNDPVFVEHNFEKTNVKIRGRGNSTWSQPKKPYKLKFENKVRLFGESKGKIWVLLANYCDKTALRNDIAFKLSEMSNLAWTPCSHFVELFLNDKFQGNYQLTEQIKIAEDRVKLPEGGMILEIDHPTRVNEDDIYFNTDSLLMVIKDPDVKDGSAQYEWAKNHMTQIERVLFGKDFLSNDERGYKNYIDLESFADWYLVNEIMKNKDANFFLSCFMTIAPEQKLKMGPVWDFDLALGNYDWTDYMFPEGFRVRNCSWFNRLFEVRNSPVWYANASVTFIAENKSCSAT